MNHFPSRFIPLLIILISFTSIAQKEVSINSDNYELFGTLMEPEQRSDKAVLIISGSGPTDRDGNTQPSHINNGLKKLAEGLTKNGYTTLRYDKRGVGKSASEAYSVKELRFEQLAEDASNWINFLKASYDDVTVIGHSQGALVGMMAIYDTRVDRFISLTGMSEDAYTTVKRQLEGQSKMVTDYAYPILDSLRQGVTVSDVPIYLYALFHPDVQEYFISFIRHDPRAYMKKLSCPSLVIAGTRDLQITVEGSSTMASGSEISELKTIHGMNHVLRYVSEDVTENSNSYNKPDLPLHDELLPVITEFIERSYWYTPFLALPGTWKVDQKEQFESWTFDPEKEIFSGQGYQLINGEKRIQELLTIESREDQIIYTAKVENQNQGKGIEFTMTKGSLKAFTFENPSHDFPKKIEYQMENKALKAIVSGDKGKSFTVEMTKKD